MAGTLAHTRFDQMTAWMMFLEQTEGLEADTEAMNERLIAAGFTTDELDAYYGI